jgi:hypothetical protein
MTPYDTYRLYKVECAKSPRAIQRADEKPARLASAVSWLFHGITRAVRRPYPAAGPDSASRPAEPASRRGTIASAMESS